MKLRALDLFCGGGGVALGLMVAGFEVWGVDIKKQKNYPGNFIQGDALNPPVRLEDFDLVWASPPCQAYSVATRCRQDFDQDDYPQLIEPIREMLYGHPWTVIENVVGAPIKRSCILTGPSVGLSRIERRRYFETSFLVMFPEPRRLPKWMWEQGIACTITSSLASKSHFYPRKRAGLPGKVPLWEAKLVMGVPAWQAITCRGIGEAVPPRYTAFIVNQAVRQMGVSMTNWRKRGIKIISEHFKTGQYLRLGVRAKHPPKTVTMYPIEGLKGKFGASDRHIYYEDESRQLWRYNFNYDVAMSIYILTERGQIPS